jgi:hypothetical protein
MTRPLYDPARPAVLGTFDATCWKCHGVTRFVCGMNDRSELICAHCGYVLAPRSPEPRVYRRFEDGHPIFAVEQPGEGGRPYPPWEVL